MNRFVGGSIGVDQGDDLLFSDCESGGDFWVGSGTRERRQVMKFREAFKSAPIVHIGLSMWDIDNDSNARADVTVEHITEKSFDVVFRTWGDTRVARSRVRWMAIGEVLCEDDWVLTDA